MNKTLIGLSGALLLLGACKAFDSGSKTEANAVTRKYARPASDVWNAVTSALQALDLRIEEDQHDALGGNLKGVRATGDEVIVKVKSIDEQSAYASVAIEEGDRNMAEIIHSQIAKNLGAGSAKTGFYGGNRLEQTYEASLARGVLAAERACEAVGFSVTNRDIHENWADLMARRSGSATILVHLETMQDPAQGKPGQAPPAGANGGTGVPSDRKVQVKVSFIVGTMRSDENEELLHRLRQEFERILR
jgi:uncharacterized protein DUF3568